MQNSTKFALVWDYETRSWVQPRFYVNASQGGVATVVHFATLGEANANVEERKAFRGFARGVWTEVSEGLPPSILRKAVWTSIRKDGRPGKLRHVLYIVALDEEAE